MKTALQLKVIHKVQKEALQFWYEQTLAQGFSQEDAKCWTLRNHVERKQCRAFAYDYPPTKRFTAYKKHYHPNEYNALPSLETCAGVPHCTVCLRLIVYGCLQKWVTPYLREWFGEKYKYYIQLYIQNQSNKYNVRRQAHSIEKPWNDPLLVKERKTTTLIAHKEWLNMIKKENVMPIPEHIESVTLTGKYLKTDGGLICMSCQLDMSWGTEGKAYAFETPGGEDIWCEKCARDWVIDCIADTEEGSDPVLIGVWEYKQTEDYRGEFSIT